MAERGPPPDRDDAAVEVPYAELSATALRGVVESWVLREGTDYGERTWTFEEKVSEVLASLACGEATIMFDPASHSVAVVPAPRR